MPRIFISYRRSASDYLAKLLHIRLAEEFGTENVFLDIDSIPLGENFKPYILEKIRQCDVFLLCLASGTLDRIHDENDYVRIEVAEALKLSHVRVIPLLINNFPMPESIALPPDIRAITELNAQKLIYEFSSESINKIINYINNKQISNPSERQVERKKETKSEDCSCFTMSFAIVILLLILFLLLVFLAPQLNFTPQRETPTSTELPTLSIVIQQPTDTSTSSPTYTLTQTVSATALPTETIAPTITIPTATLASTITQMPTNSSIICQATITTEGLRVRQFPTLNSAVLGQLALNQVLNIFSMDDTKTWLQISYNGQLAWISSDHTQGCISQPIATSISQNNIPILSQETPNTFQPSITQSEIVVAPQSGFTSVPTTVLQSIPVPQPTSLPVIIPTSTLMPQNLLVNGNFESGNSGWNLANKWEITSIDHSSNYLLSEQIEGNESGFIGISQKVQIQENTSYQVVFTYKTENTAEPHLKIIWLDSNFLEIPNTVVHLTLAQGTGWQSISRLITSPPNSSYADIVIWHGFANGQNMIGSRICIDEVSFIQID